MGAGGGGAVRSAIFCSFAIPRNFPQFFCNPLLPVPLACLLVPCVAPVHKCCSLRLWEVWLRKCNFPTIIP